MVQLVGVVATVVPAMVVRVVIVVLHRRIHFGGIRKLSNLFNLLRKSRWFSSKLWLNHVSLIIFFFSSKFFWERNYYLIGRLAKNLILETICLFHFVRVLPRENVETKKSNQKFIFCLSPLFLVQLESVMRQNIRRLSFQYLFFYLETIFFLAWWWWFLQVFVQIFSFGFPLSKLAWKKDTKMNVIFYVTSILYRGRKDGFGRTYSRQFYCWGQKRRLQNFRRKRKLTTNCL